MGLNVLFVGGCCGSLRSAQLVFNEDQTVRSLECGDEFDKAAEFLLEHTDSLIIFEEPASGIAYQKMVSRLIADGNSAAWITVHSHCTNAISCEVHVYRADESLRKLFTDGNVLRALAVAWRYCTELSQQRDGHSSSPKALKIM